MNAMTRSLLSLALCGAVGTALAAADRGEVEAQYRADRQSCMAQADADARHACLREAGAVRQERLKGMLTPSSDTTTLTRNALARCQVHRDPVEKTLCERMVLGEGEVRGDVASGGMIREITVTLPPDTPAVRTP